MYIVICVHYSIAFNGTHKYFFRVCHLCEVDFCVVWNVSFQLVQLNFQNPEMLRTMTIFVDVF